MAAASHRGRSIIEPAQRVFDEGHRCRMLSRHASTEKWRCFVDVCCGVLLGSGSLVVPLQGAHPECVGRADQLSMRRTSQTTMRGSFGSCWCGECDAHSLGCQIVAASDIGRAPDDVKQTC